jgi:hypothetical protein
MKTKSVNGVKRQGFDMDRKKFVLLCQRVSILTGGVFGIKKNVPNELQVVYDGIKYYPVAYELSFSNGNPIHSDILHDLKANSTITVPLNLVEGECEC